MYAFLDGETETVVLQTDERVAERVVGHDSDSVRFELSGRTYEATIEREGN
ncbi:hypothetical protein [Haladaptatus cibarius]|uniref:hypothetical protein n=1 Tax=Haladaptatus cibarius TaxID=453847 RepID=UPI000AA3C8A0|nr:hypothetical protein [Haladaptatus cibarius]